MKTRAELVSEYRALLAQGLTRAEIATRYEKSYTAVTNLLADPDGSKQQRRHQSYQGICRDCGKPTSGSNGRLNAPARCNDCANAPWSYCANGHELTPENRLPRGAGHSCRLCRNVTQREYSYRKRREAGAPERGPYLDRHIDAQILGTDLQRP